MHGLTAGGGAHNLDGMPTDEIVYGTITEIAQGIREKEFSPTEIIEAYLERISKLQPKLNAFVHIDTQGALKAAQAADAAMMRGERLGPLHGVPVTVKSCIDVASWPAATLGRGCRPGSRRYR